jgi:hypothetical protein
VAGPADLEVDAVLTLELDFPVVDAPGHVHRPIDADQGTAVETLQLIDGLRRQVPFS